MTHVKSARVWVVLLVAAIVFTVDSHAQTHGNEYKPSWSVGQEWRVEVERMSEPPNKRAEEVRDWKPHRCKTVYRFKVEALTEIDGEVCFRMRIDPVPSGTTSKGPFDIYYYYRVAMRQSDGTLKMVQRLREPEEKVEASDKFAAVPVDATDWVGLVPMAVPSFALREEKHVPLIRRGPGGVSYKGMDVDECSQTQQEIAIDVEGKETEALRVVLEKTEGGIVRLTTQTWVKGKPWWVEARHERGGQEWCSARLLKE